MSVQIITDTASDITMKEAAAMGITLIPLIVTFGNQSYRDGIDLDHDGFFSKLIETDVMPVTSQIPPEEYAMAYEAALSRDTDVVCITLSSTLSGCCQSACIAREGRDRIHVVDSLNACIGQRLLVELAVRYRDMGLSAAEIADRLDTDKHQIKLIALLDTLEYLHRGGRISKTIAVAGTLLSIKPVITIEDGEIKLLGKARGSKNGSNMLKNLIRGGNGIDFNRPVCLAYSGLSTALLDKYLEDSKALYAEYSGTLPVTSIGSVIGTHIGPGAIAAAYFEKQ